MQANPAVEQMVRESVESVR